MNDDTNDVRLKGNLARDPVVRSTKTGKAVAQFTIAVNREYITPQGEKKETTDWPSVVAWGALAEQVGNLLRKGTQVIVRGRYTTRSYDDQNGQRRWVTEVAAEEIALPLWSVAQLMGHQAQAPAGSFNNQAPAGGFNNAVPAGGFSQFGEVYKEPQPMKQDAIFPAGGGEEIPF